MFRVDVEGKELIALSAVGLSDLKLTERFDLQEWIDKSPSMLGEDLLIVGKELELSQGARLDLLGVDRNGCLVVIELKRGRSGRNVEWQAIRYASYVSSFSEEEVVLAYADYLGGSEAEARERIREFVGGDVSELNGAQRIILVAGEFHSDAAASVLWLRDQGIDVSCIRIRPFVDSEGRVFISPETIIPLPEAKDYIVRKERREKEKREREPFSEFLMVNVGEGPHRHWDDCRKYGYLSAGHGRKWSKQMERLRVGDRVFAYLKGRGYVGFGVVTGEAVRIGEFVVEGEGTPLLDLPLVQPDAGLHRDDEELSEYVVGVDWRCTFGREEAKFFSGIFSHPSVVARMREGRSVDFLREAFGVEREG